MEFAALNKRLTEACKTRLGELASVKLPSGKELTGVRVVVDRDREFVGTNGQVSDHRISVKIANVDLAGEAVKGAKVTLTANSEVLFLEATVGDDGQFMEFAAR